jgi:hypothetical protein
VTTYRVYRDGVQVGSSASTSYDDTTVLPGQHVYTVYAEDGAGNLSPPSAPYVVTVSAAKSASLKRRSTDHTGPKVWLVRHRLRSRHLRLTAKARDKSGIARVELRIDRRQVRARRIGRVSYTWLRRPGRHRIGVVAWDRHGNRTTYQLSLYIPRA